MPALDLLDVAPATMSDVDLLDAGRALGETLRRVRAACAAVAAEIDHRSRRELGLQGLAQRTGAHTAENLVQQVTDISHREAASLVRVGTLLTPDADPWLASVGTAVKAGHVSIEKADAIRAGLGFPTGDVAADDLADAAQRLATLAPTMTVENVAARAREYRDDLDEAGVKDRERLMHDKRYMSFVKQSDGMLRVNGLLDGEGGALVMAAYDASTSPRRGGPRFVDAETRAAHDAILNDPRTVGQITADTFVELIRLATAADPKILPAAPRHAVQVLVTAADLRSHTGAAFFRGQPDPVSVETAERHICNAGTQTIMFNLDGEPFQVGNLQRLYSSRQRKALEARDGGCRFPECDRPASWTEAHHIIHWSHGGKTDIANGILLCRHHHMLIHDNGWQIIRNGPNDYSVVPPRTLDPAQTPIPMPARSRVAARLNT
ncbi:MAG: DUF222 domain-containing protein [Pseudolysinimonas sp.]|uniref:HNH endonuclease signature motif containing protein n=1 Tax=Pseudolysinimonas sp. TaxID=2680009 RepID=UPI0032675B8E